jgi:hypothetical protein
MKRIILLVFILLSINSYGKLMNELGPTSKPIWDSIPEPVCVNDSFYQGVTIMLVVGSDIYNGQIKYWDSHNKVYLYYLDDFKKMSKRGANLYFFMSPEVSKSTILETLPLADMIVYIGHGGFQNNIPSVFNMEIPIKQYLKENPNIKNVTSSNGMIPYDIKPSDLKNIKLKSNSIVFMFTVCHASGESACDPVGGISVEEAELRTKSYSDMFLGRGAKCYFSYNILKPMFSLFESGQTIKDVRDKLIKSVYGVNKTNYDKYFSSNHIIYYDRSNVIYTIKSKEVYVLTNSFGYCLVGDFSYNINTLKGK